MTALTNLPPSVRVECPFRIHAHGRYDSPMNTESHAGPPGDAEALPEDLDHPVDNAPVRTLVHKNLTVEGYSRAAVQTYWRIPEMKLGFDLGGQPWSFMS